MRALLRVLLAKDLRAACLVGGVSCCVGVGSNLLRSESLPWNYEPPARALVAEEFLEAGAGNGGVTNVRIVSLEDTQRLVASKQVLILDARPDLFHQLGHIKGAHSLSRKNFDQDFARLARALNAARKNQQPILLYCADIHCPDAGIVARKLLDQGFTRLLVFEGGWAEWEEAGLPSASS